MVTDAEVKKHLPCVRSYVITMPLTYVRARFAQGLLENYVSTLHKVCAAGNYAQSSLRRPVLAVLRLFPGCFGLARNLWTLRRLFAHAKKVRKPPCDTLLEFINKQI